MKDHQKATRWLTTLILVGLISACEKSEIPPAATAGSEPVPDCNDVFPEKSARIKPGDVRIKTIASGLEVPWDLEVLDDGRILVTERKGRIRLIEPETGLREEPWATLPVFDQGIVGLMGIALSPRFEESRYVYVTSTYRAVGTSPAEKLLYKIKKTILTPFQPDIQFPIRNRIYRLEDQGLRGANPTIIIDSLPSHEWYGTSSLGFGPDDHLYVTTGDSGVPPLAQNVGSLAGKMLRYEEDGSLPNDNPISDSPVYALGFRNSQGFDWDAEGRLFSTEHGPTGYDELNMLIPGGNYGWPNLIGPSEGTEYKHPVLTWFSGIAPSGLAVFDRPGHPWDGNLLVASLKTQQLRRLAAYSGADGKVMVCEQLLFTGTYGRLRAVHMGTDGYVYVTTSNRDHRGAPSDKDDRILRVEIP